MTLTRSLGCERRLDEDFGERHAAPRDIVIALVESASSKKIMFQCFGRVSLPLTNLAGAPQTGTKHRSRNSCSAGIRSSNFTPIGVLALLTQTIVGIALRLKSATTASRLVDILHRPPIVQRCMRGDTEGTRSRLQPRAWQFSVGYLNSTGRYFLRPLPVLLWPSIEYRAWPRSGRWRRPRRQR